MPSLLPLAKITGKAARVRDHEAYSGLLRWGTRASRTDSGSPVTTHSTYPAPYLISSILLISVIISGQLVAAQGAGICLGKAVQCTSPGLVLIS